MSESASEKQQRLGQSHRRHAALARPHLASAESRIRSLVHRFTALVEDPRRDPGPFHELLAERFSLHYTEPPIDSLTALAGWVAGPLSSVVASEHVIGDITLRALSANEYLATVPMQSEALFPDGSSIASRNTQTWTVIDDPAGRFPRIRTITIRRHELRRL